MFNLTCSTVTAHDRDVNTLRPRQNGRRFADDTFKRIFLNENVGISIKISLKFVPKGPINNNPALVQIMAWRRSGDKPLSEPMMISLLTLISVTRLQWVKWYGIRRHIDGQYQAKFIYRVSSSWLVYHRHLLINIDTILSIRSYWYMLCLRYIYWGTSP